MSEQEHQHDDAKPIAAAVYRKQPLRIIWLLPVIALLTAGWFLWSSLASRGPEVTIQFETADGLEVGKSQIKHKDVVLGTIIRLRPVDGFKHVDVTARMNRLSEDYLKKDTKFWIVRPQVSVEGITGLNTLLSGAYIEMAPGGGEDADHFVGLEEPLLISPDAKGKSYTLLTEDLGTLEQGSSVIFHGVKVGEILGYRLSTENPPVAVQIFVNDPYTELIHNGTRFWNASGVDVSVGAQGLKIAARSLKTIFLGGVMFDVPNKAVAGPPANAGDQFQLFADQQHAEDSIYTTKVHYLLKPPGSIAGVDPGDDVTMFGQKIGYIEHSHVEFNSATGKAEAQVQIAIEPERLIFTDIDVHNPNIAAQTTALFENLAAQKLRAQLISSNLLTGEKQVNFSFVEDAAPAAIQQGGKYPEFPVVPPDDLNSLMRSAKKALNSADALISSPDMKHSIHELDKSLTNIDSITHKTDEQIGPLLTQLRSFASSADGMLKNVGSSSNSGGDLPGTLRELRDAARSVRVLADYLESHPESLLQGKSK